MIAQCSTCGQTFPVEEPGAMHCPHCGTHVYIEAPQEPGAPPPEAPSPGTGDAGGPGTTGMGPAGGAGGAGGGPGDVGTGGAGGYGAGGAGGYDAGGGPGGPGGYGAGGGAGGPGGYGAGGPGGPGMPPPPPPPPPGAPYPGGPPAESDPNPWDRKEELGFFGAFVQTVKEILLAPAKFFGSMRVDNTNGAFSFAFICMIVGGYASLFWQWIQFRVQGGMMPPEADMAEFAEMMRWMELAFGGLGFVLLPIWIVIYLFLWAGMLHLAVMLLGANNHGWNATFRAVCYAQAPQLFGVVPFCGGLVAAIWSLVLYIMALTWLHRTTPGRAVGAVFFWLIVCCCLCGGIFVLAIMGGLSAAGGGW